MNSVLSVLPPQSLPAHLLSTFRPKTGIRIATVASLAALFCCGRLAAQETDSAAASALGETAATANPRTPTPDQIARWITDLSHDAFSVRQAATASLLSAGMAAREQLVAIANGPDPETRSAGHRLIALIDSSEFQRRLTAFAADTDGRQGLTLPGWEKFRELIGGDPGARALFVEMQRREGSLIASAFGARDQPPEELLEARVMRLLQWPAAAGNRNASPPLGSCAAMVFLATAPRMTVSENGAMLVASLIECPPIRGSLQPGSPQDAIRRLVVNWILHCPNRNESVLSRRLMMASNLGLEEALALAVAVATGDLQYTRTSPSTKAIALMITGQFGRPETVDHLEPLLDDSSVCIPANAQPGGQPAGTVQVRDVALVVMLQLTNQQPADYGYGGARLIQPQRIFQLNTLARENDEQRAEAIAKWRAWRTAQKSEQAGKN